MSLQNRYGTAKRLIAMDTSTRIIDLTVGEFKAIIGREVERRIAALAIEQNSNVSQPEQPEFDGPFYGLNGIARALHCSRAQASKLKREGLLEGGYSQIGHNIEVRSARALRDILEQRSMRRRMNR